jgi:membrane fusion protein (multidrug efflux system)
MRRSFIITGLALAIVFGGLAAFNYILKPALIADFLANRKPPPITVQVATAVSKTWQPRLSAIGSLTAIKGVSVAPEVAGRVIKINFDSGQQVKAGTILIELNIEIEKAQLKEALATLQLANLDLARGRELFLKGNFSRASLDKSVASRDQAAAIVDRIRATIAQKSIRAPFDGRLGIRKIDLGQYLSAGTAIVTLQALDPIFVDFTLPENVLSRVKTGQLLRLTFDGLPGKTFDGRIESIDAQVDRATRNVLVRGRLSNPGGVLIPGMFVNVDALIDAPVGRVTVPRTAIGYSLYGDSVFVVEKDKSGALIAVRRAVKTGSTRGNEVAVVSGLKAGERVVVAGQIKLRNGARIAIDNSVNLDPPKKDRPKP